MNRLRYSRWSQDSEEISSNLVCLCPLGPRFWCMFHRRQQSWRWCFAKHDSPSQAAGHPCYSRWPESKGKCSLSHGWDLHPFSFLPQNLSPVTMLLSQMLSQRRGPIIWSGSALRWSVEQWMFAPGLAPIPRFWGLRPSRSFCSPQGCTWRLCVVLALLRSSRCSAPEHYHSVWFGGLAARTSRVQRLPIFQQGCFQRTLLTTFIALIQRNQAHHLKFQIPTEHLINNKWSHAPQCVSP